MTGFTKFDPRAFLEREHRGDGTALASLAGLAGVPSQSRNSPRKEGIALSALPLPEPEHSETPAKVAKVAKASPPIVDAQAIRHAYEARRQDLEEAGGFNPAQAEYQAWRATAAAWYRRHAPKTPPTLCAGCGEPFRAGGVALDLLHGDGERVHIGGRACLARFERKWQSMGSRALGQLGIETPRAIMREIGEDRPAADAGHGRGNGRADDYVGGQDMER